MKIKLFWGVFLSFLVANAQDVPCFEKEGLFLDSPTRLSSLGGYFHLVDASIPRPVYFVEYNPGLRIEYLYRKGVFVNIWSYRNATEGLRMSNYNTSSVPEETVDRIKFGYEMPADTICWQFNDGLIDYNKKREHISIKCARYWKKRSGYRYFFTPYQSKIRYIEGGEVDITIPNYRYRWWMNEKRAFLTIRAKLYYITKFEYIEPEIKAFKKYIRK